VTGHNELSVSDRSQRTECQWQVSTNWVSVTGHNELSVSEKLQKNLFLHSRRGKHLSKTAVYLRVSSPKSSATAVVLLAYYFPSGQPRTLIRAGATYLGYLSGIPVPLW